ncbi:MAG: guanylate kinase [Dysgonamonadaceae bacterium]|jgi:guanylate kinase|nr:guanylate kinase [Dysgonamonadaceae bacterium]
MGGKLIIISAPSGSGKSTIISYVLSQGVNLQFSISATSRTPRGNERHGVEYYFLSGDDFRTKIRNGEFLEYEEVYPGLYYGTLKSEINRIFAEGKNVILDLDVVGGCNVRNYYGDKSLSIFIQPPSVNELKKRLEARGTDTPETIDKRVSKAKAEMEYASLFDKIIINDNLENAQQQTLLTVKNFLKSQ